MGCASSKVDVVTSYGGDNTLELEDRDDGKDQTVCLDIVTDIEQSMDDGNFKVKSESASTEVNSQATKASHSESKKLSESKTASDSNYTSQDEIPDDSSSTDSFDISNAIDEETLDKSHLKDEDTLMIPIGYESTDHSKTLSSFTNPSSSGLGMEGSQNDSGSDSMEEEYFRLSQSEKVYYLEDLVREFTQIAKDINDIGSILPLLHKLYFIILYERDAYIFRQFYFYMSQYALMNQFLQILYHYHHNGECSILSIRLLVFYFINSVNIKKDIENIILNHGVSILLYVLKEYSNKQDALNITACDILSLFYLFCQDNDFCVYTVNEGGLVLFYDYLTLLIQMNAFHYLDITIETNDDVERLDRKKNYSNVKNISFYVFYVLAMLANIETVVVRIGRLDLIDLSMHVLSTLVSIFSATFTYSKPSLPPSREKDTEAESDSDSVHVKGRHRKMSTGSISIRYITNHDTIEINENRVLSFSNSHNYVIMAGENEADNDDDINMVRNTICSIIDEIMFFLEYAVNDKLCEMSLIKEGNLETIKSLLSFHVTMINSVYLTRIIHIITVIVKSHNISNNVLSTNQIDTLLMDLLCRSIEDMKEDEEESRKEFSNTDKKSVIMQAFDLIAHQCKYSSISRDKVDVARLLKEINTLFGLYDKNIFLPNVIDCLLAVSDLNEENLEIIATSNVVEEIYSAIEMYYQDESIIVKFSMITAIYSNFFGFDEYFLHSTVISILKSIISIYSTHVVIMQNCLLSLYYLSHMSIIYTIDKETWNTLSSFVQQNNGNSGIVQRYNILKDKLLPCSV